MPVNSLLRRCFYPRHLPTFATFALAVFVSLTAAHAQTAPTAPATIPAVPTVPATGVTTAAPAPTATTPTISEAQNAAAANAATANANQAAAQSGTAVADPPTPFQFLVQETVGIAPPIFGASLFSRPPSTFAPVDNTPVPADYVIGPGDTLQITTTGLYVSQQTLTVDRNGSINYPGIGLISVTGVHFAQLQDYLTQQVGRIFRNFNLSVSLGALRTIQVYVLGQARRPGLYTVSSLTTLLNAIFTSGGPLNSGSLRNIQLKRGDRVVTNFDLYDLLLRGDRSHDVRLETNDILYIPPVGPQVALLGSVTTPAIYELRGDTTLNELTTLGSGLATNADSADVRVERVSEHRERSLTEVDLSTGGTLTLRDGDIVTVREISNRFKDAVTLRGNVTNPGRYPWRPGMRLLDLVPSRDALITREYFRQRNLVAQNSYSIPQGRLAVGTPPTVSAVTGQVTSGTTASGTTVATGTAASTSNSSGSGSTVSDALTQSSSTFGAQNQIQLSAPDVDLAYAVVERQDPVTLVTSLVPFNPGRLLNDHDESQNLPLFPGDVITFFSKADIRVPSSQQTRFVRLEGEFVQAGLYSVEPGETLRSLIQRAGGLTPDAYLYASEFTRQSTRRIQQQRLQEYADSLEAQIDSQSNQRIATAITAADTQSISVSAASARAAVERLRQTQVTGRIVLKLAPTAFGVEALPDLPLEDGDRFIVSRQPSTVTVAGQVYNASAFLYTPRLEVRYYLRDAGGPDRFADKKRLFVIRADGSVVSEQFHHVAKATILPGDTVVVPPKIGNRSILQDILTVTTLVAPIGSSLGLIALLRN